MVGALQDTQGVSLLLAGESWCQHEEDVGQVISVPYPPAEHAWYPTVE